MAKVLSEEKKVVLRAMIAKAGPTTSAEMAKELGQTSVAVGFHLREMARLGILSVVARGVYQAKEGINIDDLESVKSIGERAPRVSRKNPLQELDTALNIFIDKMAAIRGLVLTAEEIEDYRRLKDQEQVIIAAVQKRRK